MCIRPFGDIGRGEWIAALRTRALARDAEIPEHAVCVISRVREERKGVRSSRRLQNIVRAQEAAGPQVLVGDEELPRHVGKGMPAVVEEEVDAPDLFELRCQRATRITEDQTPRRSSGSGTR